MKKSLLILLSALVLVGAVLCTAGCVASTDKIVGEWQKETDAGITYAGFAEDGTGYFAADKDSAVTLTWKANGDKTYTFLFADGTTKTGTLDAARGLMKMSDGSVLEKQASKISGLAQTDVAALLGICGLSAGFIAMTP